LEVFEVLDVATALAEDIGAVDAEGTIDWLEVVVGLVVLAIVVSVKVAVIGIVDTLGVLHAVTGELVAVLCLGLWVRAKVVGLKGELAESNHLERKGK
jgi:xanthine/uracil permease